MKEVITVQTLKDLVKQYIDLTNDAMEDSTEWAYAVLEPALIKSEEVTLKYLEQISEDEFIILGETNHFLDILGKFKSSAILNAIQQQYRNFFGESTDTEFYQDYIDGLDNYLR